jgi:hypothetical protein
MLELTSAEEEPSRSFINIHIDRRHIHLCVCVCVKVWIADPCGYGGNGAYSWGVSGEGIKQRCGVWRNRKREGEERRGE